MVRLMLPAIIFVLSALNLVFVANHNVQTSSVANNQQHPTPPPPKLRILIIVGAMKVALTHFKLHVQFAQLLAQDKENVEQVYVVGMAEDLKEEEDGLMEGGRLVVMKRNRCGPNPSPDCVDKGGKLVNVWAKKYDFYPNNEENHYFLNFIQNNKKLFHVLKQQNFNVGVIEIIGLEGLPLSVFQLFPTIQRTVGTSSVSPNLLHWKHLGYSDIVQQIPGQNLAFVDSHKRVAESNPAIGEYNNKWLEKMKQIEIKTYKDYANAIKSHRIQLANGRKRLLTMEEQFMQMSIFLVNTQPFLDYKMVEEEVRAREGTNHPGPKLRFFGGIALPALEQSKIKEDTKQIFESAEQLVYISFGTVVNMGEPSKDKISLEKEEAFKEMVNHPDFADVHFIWKYGQNKEEYEQPEGTNGRVHAKAWLEQPAILYEGGGLDGKLIAFISHCGLNSVNEAVIAGVPLICIPFFGDQINNSEALASREVAIVVDVYVSKEAFVTALLDALRELKTNPMYKQNITQMQKQFRAINPKEEIVQQFAQLRNELTVKKKGGWLSSVRECVTNCWQPSKNSKEDEAK